MGNGFVWCLSRQAMRLLLLPATLLLSSMCCRLCPEEQRPQEFGFDRHRSCSGMRLCTRWGGKLLCQAESCEQIQHRWDRVEVVFYQLLLQSMFQSTDGEHAHGARAIGLHMCIYQTRTVHCEKGSTSKSYVSRYLVNWHYDPTRWLLY